MRRAADAAAGIAGDPSTSLSGGEYEEDGIDTDFITYTGEDSMDYGMTDGDMPDDAMYDDDEYDDEYEEELSSSPSIPDDNINFDLVYTLHTFIATVEGQATVQKGDHLVLLDDSNSYWWLVRVLVSQEVGYIPAENIETPYERLARLNKHRNVEIATATGQDSDALPTHVSSGELVKSRTFGDINKHSGKVSALSRREVRSASERANRVPAKKLGVLFGQTEYLEHSDLDHYDEEYMEYSNEEDDREEEEQEEEDVHEEEHVEPAGALVAEEARAPERAPLVGLYPSEERTLEDTSQDDVKRQRPSSWLGLPGSEKAFNVTRVFAGENIESDSTFKTVLLNETTTSTELVHQALQRFQLQDNVQDYAIVLHHLDGEEQILAPHERPLHLLESLSNVSAMEPSEMPSKHDSIGSLTSLIDTSSSNRFMYDYSDDRFAKLYLVRRVPRHKPTKALSMPSDTTSQDKQLRFTIQLALYESDLPEDMYFHPSTGVPTRGTRPMVQGLPVEQKRYMRLAKNATVAEVIEAGIEAFQLPDAIVDGGDDVEVRMRHDRPRTKYVLHVQTASSDEQALTPASKVLAAYDKLPLLRFVDTDSKRKSLDFAVAPGVKDDILRTDPLFVLRRAPAEKPRELDTPREPSTPRAWQHSKVLDASPPSPLPASVPDRDDELEALSREAARIRSPKFSESPRVRYPTLLQSGPAARKSPPVDEFARQRDEDENVYTRQPGHLEPLPASSVQNEVDTMLQRLALDPALDPARRALTPQGKTHNSLFSPPSQQPSSLQRTSSIRSVSAGDMAPDSRGTPSMSRRVGDRVLSDSTVATGTDRQGREKYNFHALYSIVDAMALESSLSADPAAAPNASPTSGVHRTSLMMAKLLEDSPAEKMWTKWNGLFALPWPSIDAAPSAAIENVRKHYAPLMKQITEIESALDNTLHSVLTYKDT